MRFLVAANTLVLNLAILTFRSSSKSSIHTYYDELRSQAHLGPMSRKKKKTQPGIQGQVVSFSEIDAGPSTAAYHSQRRPARTLTSSFSSKNPANDSNTGLGSEEGGPHVLSTWDVYTQSASSAAVTSAARRDFDRAGGAAGEQSLLLKLIEDAVEGQDAPSQRSSRRSLNSGAAAPTSLISGSRLNSSHIRARESHMRGSAWHSIEVMPLTDPVTGKQVSGN